MNIYIWSKKLYKKKSTQFQLIKNIFQIIPEVSVNKNKI